jgi:adenylate cyclase
MGWDPARDRPEMELLVRRVLQLDREDPRVLTISGACLGYTLGLNQDGLPLLEKATELDPNSYLAWLQRGFACLRTGKRGISHFERALRLNPRDLRAPFAQNGLTWAHLFDGDPTKAVELAEEALKQLPGFPPAMTTLIAAHAHAGNLDDVRAAVQALLAVRPATTISSMADPSRFPAYEKILIDGWRLAGMPE